MSEYLVDINNERLSFFTPAGEVKALNDVSIHLKAGEVLGIVGESGSGKSVTAYSLMGLTAHPGKLVGGSLYFNGHQIEQMSDKEMRAIRGNEISIIFQDPMTSLNPVYTVGNQIMDCLAQYGGKATFYVVGDRCPSYRAEMQRMAAEGHEIGNHTYEHKYLHKLSAAEIQYQISKGSQIIQEVSGVAPTTVRLPGGNKNATVLANVNGPIIMWSIDTLDWKTRNTQSTVDKVLGNVKDGDVVLMHELYKQTGDAAVQIIPKLVERGYQLVTVSEMAKYRGGLESGKVYSSFRP